MSWCLFGDNRYTLYKDFEKAKELLNKAGIEYAIGWGATRTNQIMFFNGFQTFLGFDSIASFAHRAKQRKQKN